MQISFETANRYSPVQSSLRAIEARGGQAPRLPPMSHPISKKCVPDEDTSQMVRGRVVEIPLGFRTVSNAEPELEKVGGVRLRRWERMVG